jgi:hypothetical protein
MKSFSFYLFLLIFLVCSCTKKSGSSKSDPIPLGTIIADVDGVTKRFDVGAIADTSTSYFDINRRAFTISIKGTENADSLPSFINLNFIKVPASYISVGAYPDSNYQVYPTIYYKSYWHDTLWNYYQPTPSSEFQCKATISSIDSTIQGSFSGRVVIYVGFNFNSNPPLTFDITNGKFNVLIKH